MSTTLAPFLDEFRGLARENPNFTFIPTIMQMSCLQLPWTGTTDHIERGMIEGHLQDTAGHLAGKQSDGTGFHEKELP